MVTRNKERSHGHNKVNELKHEISKHGKCKEEKKSKLKELQQKEKFE